MTSDNSDSYTLPVIREEDFVKPARRGPPGGPKTRPDVWAPTRTCGRCGVKFFTTHADNRTRCRDCEPLPYEARL